MQTDDGNFITADDKSTTSSSMGTSMSSISLGSTSTSITLPSSLFQRINSSSNMTGLVFTHYEASTLFPVGEHIRSSNNLTVTQVGSQIIAATIGQDIEFEDLRDPVTITLHIQQGVSEFSRDN